MTIVCRECSHAFRRANICNPKTLRVWGCPRKRCAGYGTIATLAESIRINREREQKKNEQRARRLAGWIYVGAIADE